MPERYNDLNSYLRSVFGCRVQKISIDAGLTCPNRDGTLSSHGCIYCNAKGSGTGAWSRGISIGAQIRSGMHWLARRYKARKFIAYFQSFSNTHAPLPKLKSMYDEALSFEDMVGLSIGTRPDCVDEPVLELLENYCANYLVWVEYGLQSAHNQTLAAINRGHDLQCFEHAVNLTRNRGIKICAHVILGLPGETKKEMLNTARTVAALNIDGIKLHLLYVIRGTRLEQLYRQGQYICLEQQEYAERICDFLEAIPSSMVIQRLTGDPHPAELVAPAWSLDRNATLKLIKATLEQRDTWQGKKNNMAGT